MQESLISSINSKQLCSQKDNSRKLQTARNQKSQKNTDTKTEQHSDDSVPHPFP
jgi:hypothetical protein